MKTGRNAPCPCGSGKKYKTCCLRRDQDSQVEQERTTRQQSVEAERKAEEERLAEAERRRFERFVEERAKPVERPIDPRIEAIEERMAEFEDRDFAGRMELFQETLGDPELMDDETAFQMLSSIHQDAVQNDMREKYSQMVGALRERLPEVYVSSRHFYLQMQIIDAVVEGRQHAVNALVREFAETAEQDADLFFHVMEFLKYHGYLSALVDATGIAWPIVEGSDKLLNPVEVAQYGADFALFECLERNPQLDGRDAELTTRVRYFFPELDVEHLDRYVGRLTGRLAPDWCLNDFLQSSASSKKKKQQAPSKTGRKNLRELATEFLGYLGRQEKVAFSKARLAADSIVDYILERLDGKLDRHPTQLITRNHPLCPDHATLDCYFAGQTNFFNPHYYTVAATFELLPLWLQFLEHRGLIEPHDRQASLDDLQQLKDTLLKLWSTNKEDPTLARNLESWPQISTAVPVET